jgi:hypothetical protein
VKFTGATTGGNSQVFDNGSNVIVGATTTLFASMIESRATSSMLTSFSGIGTSTGDAIGVYGQLPVASTSIRGAVQGEYLGTGSGDGVLGLAIGGTGNGVTGLKTNNVADAAGVRGENSSTIADSYGVYGLSSGAGFSSYGVYGISTSSGGNGLYGEASGTACYAVWGNDAGGLGYAGYFDGNIYATAASASIKAFKIDHPLFPATKYLYHSSVESSDMMNIYNGNVTTDANGEAVVTLPSYFQALNIDYKYQLTCIGQFAQAIIMNEISNNQFTIKTNLSNVKVSWQVTGVRNDAAAQKYRIIPEVDKEAQYVGKYLVPEAYGFGVDKAADKRSLVKRSTPVQRNIGQLQLAGK